MGPTGRNVAVQKSYGGPSVTKDGVSVAKEVELPCPFENMGAKMVHQVAKKTADVAGDGTTAATVLAAAIFNGGLKFVASGANTVALQPRHQRRRRRGRGGDRRDGGQVPRSRGPGEDRHRRRQPRFAVEAP